MSFILGIDTGGTYTDAVVVDTSSRKIICKAKSETTKWNLVTGIKNCLDLLDFHNFSEIIQVSLSTTLATNAIVEGRGGNIALIYMGTNLEGDIPTDKIIKVRGQLDIMGHIKEDIDDDEIRQVCEGLKGTVDAIAISGYAGVKEPKHEQAIQKIAREITNVPVICGHQLTSALGFYHRTVTAILNGKLIPIVDELLKSTKTVLEEKGISGKMMVVKGDGTLITEHAARQRPVDTILSGPSASIIGGLALTQRQNGIVVDIGGTTTDIAQVTNGSVAIRKEGANVGGWFTRVMAANISTFGIGGDSRIYLNKKGDLEIGPEKVIPLCVIGQRYPTLTNEVKSFHYMGEVKSFFAHEADCYIYLAGTPSKNITGKDEKILEALREAPHSIVYIGNLIGYDPETIDLTPLVNEGILGRIGVTPTDILHVQGKYNQWNRDLSYDGIEILAKRQEIETSIFVECAYKAIKSKIAKSCVQAILNLDRNSFDITSQSDYLLDIAFDNKTSDMLSSQITLKKPLIAIGAPANIWLREAGQLLNAEVLVPDNAEVANAYGAAVGQIIETVELLISAEGTKYILTFPWARLEYKSKEEAVFYAIHEGRKHIEHSLRGMGCKRWHISEDSSDYFVKISDTSDINQPEKHMYSETKMLITGIGEGVI